MGRRNPWKRQEREGSHELPGTWREARGDVRWRMSLPYLRRLTLCPRPPVSSACARKDWGRRRHKSCCRPWAPARQGGHRSLLPPPKPGLRSCPRPTTRNTLPAPARPPITTRGREKGAIYRSRPCGCPNRAGWGGLGNSWGTGEEAGFPGRGDHGTAYLEPPSLPEHAHRPHTHNQGVS